MLTVFKTKFVHNTLAVAFIICAIFYGMATQEREIADRGPTPYDKISAELDCWTGAKPVQHQNHDPKSVIFQDKAGNYHVGGRKAAERAMLVEVFNENLTLPGRTVAFCFNAKK